MHKLRVVWRLINTMLLCVAFGLPWLPIFGDTVTGIELIRYTGWQLIYDNGQAVILDPAVTQNGALLSVAALTWLALCGLLCLLVYAAINALTTLLSLDLKAHWVVIVLGTGFVAMSLVAVWASIGYGGLSRLFGGYWLAALGVASSFIQETSKRLRFSAVPPTANGTK